MRKTFLLILASCLFSSMVHAQFEVNSIGYSTSSNIMMDGVMGGAMGANGVLTVKSNRIDPKYSTMYGLGLALIRTDCGGFSGIFPFSNMNKNKMNFYVRETGQVYSVSGYLQASPTMIASRSASPVLSSSLEKLKSINGIVYTTPTEEPVTRSVLAEENNSPAVMDSAMTAQILNQMAEEENLPRFGLNAQQLEQVFPEVVRTLPDGSKGILYAELVPVLIESIKELQVQVDDLKSQLSGSQQKNAPQQASQSGKSTLGQEAELLQNSPNPFNQETEIGYRLSGDAATASICIYNLNGQQLKKYPLATDSLAGTVAVSASEFIPGIYIYSLVINSRVIDSKRMTLTD